MVRIAQFNHSETYDPNNPNSGIWGMPGDQLKVPGTYESKDTFHGELEIVKYSGSWDYVFRLINAGTAKFLMRKAEQTVRNPHVGYSQNNEEYPRTSFFDALEAAGWDPSKIKTDCNGDCSSGMAAWLNAVGIEVDKNMWTGNEKEQIEATGRFLTLTDPLFTDQDEYLMPGDILLRLNPGHTALVLDWGDYVKSSVPGFAKGDSWQRSQPYATDSNGLAVVKRDEPVEGYLPIMGGKWWLTDHCGSRGWESEKYIEWLYYCDITGYQVNMRKSPTINSKVLDVVRLGERYLSTGISAEDGRGVVWYQINNGDEIGWVSSVYAELGGYI